MSRTSNPIRQLVTALLIVGVDKQGALQRAGGGSIPMSKCVTR